MEKMGNPPQKKRLVKPVLLDPMGHQGSTSGSQGSTRETVKTKRYVVLHNSRAQCGGCRRHLDNIDVGLFLELLLQLGPGLFYLFRFLSSRFK